MIDPGKVCLFIPPNLKAFKLKLFERIGGEICRQGGLMVRGRHEDLLKLPKEITPIVGCTPAVRPLIDEWMKTGRQWIYWDRGYWNRVFATWLPRGNDGGFYRWHVGSFQMSRIRDKPADRYDRVPPPVRPWRGQGNHIVLACPTPTYAIFHNIPNWTEETIRKLSLLTQRQIVVRDKESKRPLQADLEGAHALVAHGSNTAVESVVLGCPVFVHKSSAAALVGSTDLAQIERPNMPDRSAWLRALAYGHFDEKELVNGVLWKLLE